MSEKYNLKHFFNLITTSKNTIKDVAKKIAKIQTEIDEIDRMLLKIETTPEEAMNRIDWSKLDKKATGKAKKTVKEYISKINESKEKLFNIRKNKSETIDKYNNIIFDLSSNSEKINDTIEKFLYLSHAWQKDDISEIKNMDENSSNFYVLNPSPSDIAIQKSVFIAPSNFFSGDNYVELKLGCIVICTLMFAYDHSGIYIGEDKIVELNGDGEIKIVTYSEFLNSSIFRTGVTIYTACEDGNVLHDPKIAKRAKSLIGEKMNYDSSTNNCHIFCLHCLHGRIHTSGIEMPVIDKLTQGIMDSHLVKTPSKFDWINVKIK